MNWRVKGLVQRALGAVPGGVQVNDWLQRSLGGLRDFPGTVRTKVVSDWLVLVEGLKEMGAEPEGLRLLEVGSGWMPVLPVCFSLAGASSCTTVDVTRHMNAGLTFRMLAALEEYLPAIAEASRRSLGQVTSDYKALRSARTLEELLERARIDYISPADARSTGLSDNVLDVVFSNNVFEHVPRDVLAGILSESRRILKPGGISMHCTNCADHYAYFDRSITFLNYLSYSEQEWEFWNNKLLYQNRLRPEDFARLATEAGLEVPLEKMRTRPELLRVLPGMRIAPEFQHYSAEQLCSTSSMIGAVKPLCVPVETLQGTLPATRVTEPQV